MLQAAVALWSTQSNTKFYFNTVINTHWRGDNKTQHTHTHTEGREKTDYGVAGERVTKRAASEPFRTICYHVEKTEKKNTSRVTKRAGSASELTRFVACHSLRSTLVKKRAGVIKSAATVSLLKAACVPVCASVRVQLQPSVFSFNLAGSLDRDHWWLFMVH